jgi:GNAT superfamily N-acetyltransferase
LSPQPRACDRPFAGDGRAPYRSGAFDPVAHDLSQFKSGEADLDAWLGDHAVAAARARVAQTFDWAESDSARVLAYYAISAHAVPRVEAPSRIARGVPNLVLAALLVKLALDRSLHGQRLGDVLLADALDRIITASESGPAVRAIVVDAATDRGRALYSRFGFVPAPGRTDRMIVRAETIARGLDRS